MDQKWSATLILFASQGKSTLSTSYELVCAYYIRIWQAHIVKNFRFYNLWSIWITTPWCRTSRVISGYERCSKIMSYHLHRPNFYIPKVYIYYIMTILKHNVMFYAYWFCFRHFMSVLIVLKIEKPNKLFKQVHDPYRGFKTHRPIQPQGYIPDLNANSIRAT